MKYICQYLTNITTKLFYSDIGQKFGLQVLRSNPHPDTWDCIHTTSDSTTATTLPAPNKMVFPQSNHPSGWRPQQILHWDLSQSESLNVGKWNYMFATAPFRMSHLGYVTGKPGWLCCHSLSCPRAIGRWRWMLLEHLFLIMQSMGTH